MTLSCKNVVLLLQGSLAHGGRGIVSHVLQRQKRLSAAIQAGYVCKAFPGQHIARRQGVLAVESAQASPTQCISLYYCESHLMARQKAYYMVSSLAVVAMSIVNACKWRVLFCTT